MTGRVDEFDEQILDDLEEQLELALGLLGWSDKTIALRKRFLLTGDAKVLDAYKRAVVELTLRQNGAHAIWQRMRNERRPATACVPIRVERRTGDRVSRARRRVTRSSSRALKPREPGGDDPPPPSLTTSSRLLRVAVA